MRRFRPSCWTWLCVPATVAVLATPYWPMPLAGLLLNLCLDVTRAMLPRRR